MFAIDCGFSRSVLEFLVDQGSDINAQDSEGMTPLHVSYELEEMDTFEYLLKKGADPSIKNKDGEVVSEKAVSKFLDVLHKSDGNIESQIIG
mmetsp:Transcript_28627/g.20685  ORF Transcript_28627/g.20685 Transcript_28627/m.20685 type:complete len:92 (-) Transcript_28627:114-389(-)